MIRTLHVVIVCFTWCAIHLSDRVLEIREIEARTDALREANALLQQQPSVQVDPRRPRGGTL